VAALKSTTLYLAMILLAAVTALPAPGEAQPADAQLLSTFCAPSNIRGSACKRAKAYPNRRACDVTLGKSRYSGKFVAGRTILIADYGSECEAHVNDFGGAVLFEQTGGAWAFKGYQPGYAPHDCVVLTGNNRDRLICLTGHMGQGELESGVAEMVFSQDFSKGIKLSFDFFATADDTTSAYGANTVDCKEQEKYFGLSKLAAGPQRDTVLVTVEYADAETIKTACTVGFPKPKEVFGELGTGEAYVPTGHEKTGRFVIDLNTRKLVPEAGSGKTPAAR
jgi:hypothetical protein